MNLSQEDMKEIREIVGDCVNDVLALEKQRKEASAKKSEQKRSIDDIISERMKKYE